MKNAQIRINKDAFDLNVIIKTTLVILEGYSVRIDAF
jgi:hypothetical protein